MAAADATLSAAMPRAQPAPAQSAQDFAWRVLVLLNLFRLAVGTVLLAVFYLVDQPRIVGSTAPTLALYALLTVLTFGSAALFMLYRRTPPAAAQAYIYFAADLVTMTLLVHASGGSSSGLGGLLVVSVGTLALLLKPDRAFLLAAIAAMALLAEQTVVFFQDPTTGALYVPTGILGAAIFVVVALVQVLRARLLATEALAEQRGLDLLNLVELNEYIIQHLRESIVVVDDQDQIRLINESAIKHLGRTGATGDSLAAVTPFLAAQLGRWRAQEAADARSTQFGSADGTTTIEPHFAPLSGGRGGGVVVFLEDTSLIAERVQTAKLAALGRLSASIAHEIRNPIGAMSHAGQLLAESPTIGPEELRLTDIIRMNARRVSRIVESVLALSRRDKTKPESLQLRSWLKSFVREFTQTLELYEGAVSTADGPPVEARIDPTHLHQIVWNLCDNAVKYASATAGAIAVEIGCGHLEASGRPFLEVSDRGPGIPADKVEQIFEPFYTGQPGGTGLGLYISRELADRNAATLRYQPRVGGGSTFRIVFADPNRWPKEDNA